MSKIVTQTDEAVTVKLSNGEEVEACPICLLPLVPIWENNGFQEPDPTHYEITGYECEKGHFRK